MSWEFELINGPYGGISEGPAWDGSGLLFTHINDSRIMRYDPEAKSCTVFRENTNYAAGLVFDTEGRLYGCEMSARRVVRYEPDGGVTVIADSFEGKRLNLPNDLAVDLEGRVWFSDPWYEGAAGEMSKDRSTMELDHESVYRVDPQPDGSWKINRVTFDTTRPNGLIFTQDHKTLYVAQSGKLPDEKRELRAYPVQEDGSLGQCTVLHDFGDYRGIDGMVLDMDGNIAAMAGTSEGGPGSLIYQFSPSGEVIATHPLETSKPTNCTFGDADLKTLYATTIEGHLYRARTECRGCLLYPPLK